MTDPVTNPVTNLSNLGFGVRIGLESDDDGGDFEVQNAVMKVHERIFGFRFESRIRRFVTRVRGLVEATRSAKVLVRGTFWLVEGSKTDV